MALKLLAKGTKLQISIASTFTDIAHRVKLDGPDSQVKMTELLDLDSTYVEKAPTIVDLGSMTGTFWYDPNDTTMAALRAKVYAPPGVAAPDLWKLIWPDGMTTPAHEAFSGFLTKCSPTGIEREGYIQANFEIALTAAYAFTAGV